jgi:hypothetical protein
MPRLTLFVVLYLLIAVPAAAATYRCRDANGNWTTQACFTAVPPADLNASPYQRWLRERQPAMAARAAARTKLGPFCFRLDRLGSFYECVESQLKVYDEIERIKTTLPADSLPRRRLDACLTDNLDQVSGAVDYKSARVCYNKTE